MRSLTITRAAPEERVAVENLLQLYIHDFTDFLVGRPEAELDEHGRYCWETTLPSLPLYWSAATHVPLLMRVDGRLMGLALLDNVSHTNHALDWNMAEFFIARKYRRAGMGTAAAQAIFTRYPGRWEAAIARRNTPALPFWRKAVSRHPLVEDIHESDETGPVWNGPVIRFRIRAEK